MKFSATKGRKACSLQKSPGRCKEDTPGSSLREKDLRRGRGEMSSKKEEGGHVAATKEKMILATIIVEIHSLLSKELPLEEEKRDFLNDVRKSCSTAIGPFRRGVLGGFAFRGRNTWRKKSGKDLSGGKGYRTQEGPSWGTL